MNVWRLIVHHEAKYKEQVLNWTRREGVTAIGWGNTGNLNDQVIPDRRAMTNLVKQSHNTTPANFTNGGSSLWNLCSEVKVGDLIIVNSDIPRLVMQVTGDYYYVPGEYPYYEHRRRAEYVPVDATRLYNMSGKIAQGQNVRSTLVRCEYKISEPALESLY